MRPLKSLEKEMMNQLYFSLFESLVSDKFTLAQGCILSTEITSYLEALLVDVYKIKLIQSLDEGSTNDKTFEKNLSKFEKSDLTKKTEVLNAIPEYFILDLIRLRNFLQHKLRIFFDEKEQTVWNEMTNILCEDTYVESAILQFLNYLCSIYEVIIEKFFRKNLNKTGGTAKNLYFFEEYQARIENCFQFLCDIRIGSKDAISLDELKYVFCKLKEA